MLRAVAGIASTGRGGTGATTGASATLNLGAMQNWQIVGTKGTGPYGTKSSSGQAGNSFRTMHYLPNGGKDIQLIYAGFDSTFGSTDPGFIPSGYVCTGAVVGGAAGASYAVGDIINPTVAANQTAPKLVVTAVSAGAVTQLGVLTPGAFNTYPSASLATTHSSGSGNDALTVTLTVSPVAACVKIGLEQVWGTQTAVSTSNPNGVLDLDYGLTQQGRDVNMAIPNGGFLITKPHPLGQKLTAGAQIGARIDSNGYGFNRERALIAAEYSALSDFTKWNASTAWGGTYSSTSGNGTTPLAIMGKLDTPAPSILILGDSIANGSASIYSGGTYDNKDANGNVGWVERSIAQQQAWANWSISGETTASWMTNRQRLLQLISMIRPSHVIDELGTNDLASGKAYATFLAEKQQFWSLLKSHGVGEIWNTTITPRPNGNYGLTELPTIAAGGTGYGASQTFDVTLAGGTGTSAIVNVTSNGSGVVTTVNSITNAGSYTAVPTNPTNSPTGGTGTGLSLNIRIGKAFDLASQTAGAGNATTQTYNTNARALAYTAYGVTKCLDVAQYVESGTTGLWVPLTTYDLVHPSVSGHALMVAGVSGQFANVAMPRS